MNQGLENLNHALYKVLGIQSKCGTLLLCRMYLVNMDEPRSGWRREKREFDCFSCMQAEPLDQNYAISRSISRALSFQSTLALDLV